MVRHAIRHLKELKNIIIGDMTEGKSLEGQPGNSANQVR